MSARSFRRACGCPSVRGTVGAHALWSCRRAASAEVGDVGAARVGSDSDRTLPHLQIGLGAARHVLDDLVPRDPPEVLDPVRVEAVVRDAVGVDVVTARAALLVVDRRAPETGEGILDGWTVARPPLRAKPYSRPSRSPK